MAEESVAGSFDDPQPGYFVVATDTAEGLRLEICESTIVVELSDDKFRDVIAKIKKYMEDNAVKASPLPPGLVLSKRSGFPPQPGG